MGVGGRSNERKERQDMTLTGQVIVVRSVNMCPTHKEEAEQTRPGQTRADQTKPAQAKPNQMHRQHQHDCISFPSSSSPSSSSSSSSLYFHIAQPPLACSANNLPLTPIFICMVLHTATSFYKCEDRLERPAMTNRTMETQGTAAPPHQHTNNRINNFYLFFCARPFLHHWWQS